MENLISPLDESQHVCNPPPRIEEEDPQNGKDKEIGGLAYRKDRFCEDYPERNLKGCNVRESSVVDKCENSKPGFFLEATYDGSPNPVLDIIKGDFLFGNDHYKDVNKEATYLKTLLESSLHRIISMETEKKERYENLRKQAVDFGLQLVEEERSRNENEQAVLLDKISQLSEELDDTKHKLEAKMLECQELTASAKKKRQEEEADQKEEIVPMRLFYFFG